MKGIYALPPLTPNQISTDISLHVPPPHKGPEGKKGV